MKKYKFLFFFIVIVIVIVVMTSNTSYAKMYEYIDKDGKVVYSNVPPPASAKRVEVLVETETKGNQINKTIEVEVKNMPIQKKNISNLETYNSNSEREEIIYNLELNRLKSKLEFTKKMTSNQKIIELIQQRIDLLRENPRQYFYNYGINTNIKIYDPEDEHDKLIYNLELNRLESKLKLMKKMKIRGRILELMQKKIDLLRENPQQYFYNYATDKLQ